MNSEGTPTPSPAESRRSLARYGFSEDAPVYTFPFPYTVDAVLKCGLDDTFVKTWCFPLGSSKQSGLIVDIAYEHGDLGHLFDGRATIDGSAPALVHGFLELHPGDRHRLVRGFLQYVEPQDVDGHTSFIHL